MLIKELKEAVPCWQGFARVDKDKIYCLESKTTKTGWYKAKEKEYKLKDLDYANAISHRNSFLNNIHEERTGGGCIESRHLYEYLNDSLTEKGTSPLKDKLKKWCSQVNRRRVYPVQLGVHNNSLYVLGEEYLIIYLGVLVGVVVEDNDIDPWEEVTYYVRDLIDKTPYETRTETKNMTQNMDFKQVCKVLLSKIELIEKKIRPENCLSDIPMRRSVNSFDPKEIDRRYRIKPLAFEKKIIDAVGDKYYLERIHGIKNTAIVKTKKEKHFVGIYYQKQKTGEVVVTMYAMGDTDGRTLSKFIVDNVKNLDVAILKDNINKAMKEVKELMK